MNTTRVEREACRGLGRCCRLLCAQFAVCGLAVAAAAPVVAEELTLNQKLIVACYRVDVTGVIQHLRAGANVQATFGEVPEDV